MTKDRSKNPLNEGRNLELAMTRALVHAQPFAGDVFRVANRGFAGVNTLLSGIGAMQHGGRWNAAGEFRVFYAAMDLETAFAEKAHASRHYCIPPEQWLPAVIVLVQVKLTRVLDLTVTASRNRLGLTSEAMVAERPPAGKKSSYETTRHAIARAARQAGIEALIVPSARRPGGKNLAVFPDNLGKKSRLLIINPESLPKRR
jgi:RES domain-containing protein